MGMRATIAVITQEKDVFRTTVQWSTVLDKNLGTFAYRAQKNGEYPVESLFDMLLHVTQTWGHISSLDTGDRGTDVGHGLVVSGGEKKDSYTKEELENFHLTKHNIDVETERHITYGMTLNGGSIGVQIIEEEFFATGDIEFFYINPSTGSVEVTSVNIKKLIGFYTNGKSATLMKLPFRV